MNSNINTITPYLSNETYISFFNTMNEERHSQLRSDACFNFDEYANFDDIPSNYHEDLKSGTFFSHHKEIKSLANLCEFLGKKNCLEVTNICFPASFILKFKTNKYGTSCDVIDVKKYFPNIEYISFIQDIFINKDDLIKKYLCIKPIEDFYSKKYESIKKQIQLKNKSYTQNYISSKNNSLKKEIISQQKHNYLSILKNIPIKVSFSKSYDKNTSIKEETNHFNEIKKLFFTFNVNFSLIKFPIHNKLEDLRISNNEFIDKLDYFHCFPNLKSLTLVSLKNLSNINNLPTTIESVSIRNCNKLNFDFLYSLPNLKNLKIEECDELDKIDAHLLTNLKNIELRNCHNIKEIENIDKLEQIEKIAVPACINLKNLKKIESCTSLKILHLYKNKYILNLNKIKTLTNLEFLFSDNLKKIDDFKIFSSFSSLQNLHLLNCHDIKKIDLSDLPVNLQMLYIMNFDSLETVSNFTKLKNITHLILEDCKNLEFLPGLNQLNNSIKTPHISVKLSNCNKIQKQYYSDLPRHISLYIN